MPMSEGFFTYISKNEDVNEWAVALDWFLSNDHFKKTGWKSYISVFTKKITKIDGLEGVDIKYGEEGDLNYPARRPRGCRIVIEQYDKQKKSIGKDFVRHIRNGIAHGRAHFVKLNSEKTRKKNYIEIKDYRDDNEKHQTGYLLIPKHSLIEIYSVYLEVEKRMSAKQS